MPEKDKQNKEHSKISMKIGDVQVEFEGTTENIKKLMNKEMVDFAKKMEGTAEQRLPSPESAPKPVLKPPEAVPKVKTVPPPSATSIKAEVPIKKPRFTLGKKTEKPVKKRTNYRNLATALMMICIVLLASVIGVIAYYLPIVSDLNSQIAEKNSAIAELNANVTSLNQQVLALQDDINQQDSEVTDLQDTVDYLNELTEYYVGLLMMNASATLISATTIEPLNASESVMIYSYEYGLEYAGYVGVSVESTSNTTYVQLLYNYKTVEFNQNVTVGKSGTAYFPVLPAVIEIWVGNTDTYTGDLVNATVSAAYYY
jgi:cell division protein FtsB